jgi:DNA-binding NtrC family response regulator
VLFFSKQTKELVMKILLIDDDKLITGLFVAVLEDKFSSKYEIVAKERFSEGMEYALEHKEEISAVLLDGQIENGFGWQIAEALRLAGYQGIIFSVAGHALSEAVPASKRWPFNAWFQKPVPIDKLTGTLQDEWLKEMEK